jgi:hypothetical protein
VTVTRPARVTAQLFSPRRVKLYTWRAKVRVGGTILRLAMPRQVRRLGVYRMVWSARAGRQTVTRTIKFRVVGKRLPKQRMQIVLAGAAAKSVGPKLARRSEMLVSGVEPTFDATANRNRDVRVLVVDVDDLGLATLRDLHAVFPSVKIVALAAGPRTMAASLKAGARIVLPRSTPPTKLAKIIQQLAKKR